MQPIVVSREGVDKSVVVTWVGDRVRELLDREIDDDLVAEKEVWRLILEVGCVLLTAVLALRCWRCTTSHLTSRGLSWSDVSPRFDREYSASQNTTLGGIAVPLFAFRRREGKKESTCVPARYIPRLTPRCRSSRLLLQFEMLVGSSMGFRRAQSMLTMLTHGAVTTHDTTIAAHMVATSKAISRTWLYRTPDEIRSTLRDRAALDEQTQRPILYFSTDQHAERVYTGMTWSSQWSMLNGIRVWCTDRDTGELIPLGGEFIVGDCTCVEAAFRELIKAGILPEDGDYGDGVTAQYVFIADGAQWFGERVVKRFQGAVVILDAFHVLEKIGELATALYGSKTPEARALYARACKAITGRKLPDTPSSAKPRRGEERANGRTNAERRSYFKKRHEYDRDPNLLFAILREVKPTKRRKLPAWRSTWNYLRKRKQALGYADFWHRGFHISSAPMESFNRVAQHRVKLPGATWTPEMLQAVLTVRMLIEMGNLERFWTDTEVLAKLSTLWNKSS